MIILVYCKRSEYNTAQECLTETVGFTLSESLVKSKTGGYPQRCPLYNVFACMLYNVCTCIKKIKKKNDFHFQGILKERESSCYHKSYFSAREMFCIFFMVLLTF